MLNDDDGCVDEKTSLCFFFSFLFASSTRTSPFTVESFDALKGESDKYPFLDACANSTNTKHNIHERERKKERRIVSREEKRH